MMRMWSSSRGNKTSTGNSWDNFAFCLLVYIWLMTQVTMIWIEFSLETQQRQRRVQFIGLTGGYWRWFVAKVHCPWHRPLLLGGELFVFATFVAWERNHCACVWRWSLMRCGLGIAMDTGLNEMAVLSNTTRECNRWWISTTTHVF